MVSFTTLVTFLESLLSYILDWIWMLSPVYNSIIIIYNQNIIFVTEK